MVEKQTEAEQEVAVVVVVVDTRITRIKKNMVHHQSQRYHNLKKGAIVASTKQVEVEVEVEDEDEESQTHNNIFRRSTTTPKLFPLLSLLFFFLVSSTLFFIPHLLPPFYSFGSGDHGVLIVDTPLCSSLPYGSICCDRTGHRSDVCYMRGDITTHSASSSLHVYVPNNTTSNSIMGDEEVDGVLMHQKIKPYTRKWETSVMDTIDELDLVVNRERNSSTACEVHHSVPAVFFSTGGYTGNVYHEFNDGILPLYITSQHFNKEVVFVMLEYHDWWVSKYADVLSQLSNYPPIDFSNDGKIHCFSEVIVGLKIHDELTIDPSLMEGNKSIRDFHKLLDLAYHPRIKGLVFDEQVEAKTSSPPAPATDVDEEILHRQREEQEDEQMIKMKKEKEKTRKPRLVILSRSGSRVIINENSLVELAEEIGFQVKVLRPDPTTELAKIYRELNSSDVMLGVHGAAMTHFLFMRPGTVFIQLVPLGTDWAAQTYYGDPSNKLGLKYIGYKIHPKESSLYKQYHQDDIVLRDPDSVNAKGWEFTKKVYLDGQNVRLDLSRFRKRLVWAYDYTISKQGVPS